MGRSIVVIWLVSGLVGGIAMFLTGRFLIPAASPAFAEAVGTFLMGVVGLSWTRRARGEPIAFWKNAGIVFVASGVVFLIRWGWGS